MPRSRPVSLLAALAVAAAPVAARAQFVSAGVGGGTGVGRRHGPDGTANHRHALIARPAFKGSSNRLAKAPASPRMKSVRRVVDVHEDSHSWNLHLPGQTGEHEPEAVADGPIKR